MNFRLLIFFSCLCYFFSCCSVIPNELKTAEQLVDSRPDSALKILQLIHPQNIKSESSRALYGLLLFQALDNNSKPLKPDSLLNFSISFYQSHSNKIRLATCYYLNGRHCLMSQRYDDATIFYMKALDCLQDDTESKLHGLIYGDMGDICCIQQEYKESLKKYRLSVESFNKAGEKVKANFKVLAIGRTFRLLKNYNTALYYYRIVDSQHNDSMLLGVTYQEIGINYYKAAKLDSAKYYLQKSLYFPARLNNYSYRCFYLADLNFDTEQYDSASYYAKIALKYPSTFFIQRECYRILVDVEYLHNDIKQMGKYMTQYQNCCDSVRKVESQTKITVLENIHAKSQETNEVKQNLISSGLILVVVLISGFYFVYVFYTRNKFKKGKIELFENKIASKQDYLTINLSKRIEDTRILQQDMRKSASAAEREILDINLYTSTLHLNDWSLFKSEMNQAFNQIIDKLEMSYPTITRKEITWCCFQLLEIPNSDRMLLLYATSDSLYKLKQRLARKMNLQTTKEIDSFLKKLTTIQN